MDEQLDEQPEAGLKELAPRDESGAEIVDRLADRLDALSVKKFMVVHPHCGEPQVVEAEDAASAAGIYETQCGITSSIHQTHVTEIPDEPSA